MFEAPGRPEGRGPLGATWGFNLVCFRSRPCTRRERGPRSFWLIQEIWSGSWPMHCRVVAIAGMADALPCCSYCGFRVWSRKRCSCRTTAYCDEVCQRRHWREHKVWCSWRRRDRVIRLLVLQHGLEPAVFKTLVEFVDGKRLSARLLPGFGAAPGAWAAPRPGSTTM